MLISQNKTPAPFPTRSAAVAADATMIDAVVQPTVAPGSPRGIEMLRFNEDYLQALTNRGEDAVRHLISHFSRPLKSKLAGQLRSPELREDAFQETFWRVLTYFQSGKTVKNPASLPAFVFAVSHNTALELLRWGSGYKQSQAPSDPVDPAQSPEDRVMLEERKQIVRRVLHELREKDLELVQRVFFDEEDKPSLQAARCRQELFESSAVSSPDADEDSARQLGPCV